MEPTQTASQPVLDSRKAWEEPKIVLERLLLVTAQGSPPGGPPFSEQPGGFIGPLSTSGGIC